MSTLINSRFVELHSQHTLRHTDWMVISNLAKAEDIDQSLSSWDFEDFLGLAIYSFVTTQSQDTRKQLSQLLPKFGSAVVLPLLKILSKKEVFVEQQIPTLAQYSLTHMEPYSLVIGLNQILNLKIQANLRALALNTLRQCIESSEPSTNLILTQLLSEENRQLISEVADTSAHAHTRHGKKVLC